MGVCIVLHSRPSLGASVVLVALCFLSTRRLSFLTFLPFRTLIWVYLYFSSFRSLQEICTRASASTNTSLVSIFHDSDRLARPIFASLWGFQNVLSFDVASKPPSREHHFSNLLRYYYVRITTNGGEIRSQEPGSQHTDHSKSLSSTGCQTNRQRPPTKV